MTRDRDHYVEKHTPRTGVPAFVEEEATDKYEGEELARVRARRPTPERIGRLETKHDELAKVVTETRVLVGEMNGKLEVLPELISIVRTSADHAAERERMTLADTHDGRATRRKALLQIIGAVLGGGVLAKILHALGAL